MYVVTSLFKVRNVCCPASLISVSIYYSHTVSSTAIGKWQMIYFKIVP